jgi:thymidylate synthase
MLHGKPNHDGDVKILEVMGVSFNISKPNSSDFLAMSFGKPEMINAMVKNFNTNEPQFGFKFSYGARIFSGENSGGFEDVARLLRRKPEAKSASISLLRSGDFQGSHVPCITTIDFKLRDNKLHIYYFARSQDIFKKNYADNIAILKVGERLATELNVEIGTITGMIASAHIYEADFHAANQLLTDAQLVFESKEGAC